MNKDGEFSCGDIKHEHTDYAVYNIKCHVQLNDNQYDDHIYYLNILDLNMDVSIALNELQRHRRKYISYSKAGKKRQQFWKNRKETAIKNLAKELNHETMD